MVQDKTRLINSRAQKTNSNSLTIQKLIIAHPGKVRTHVSTISFTTPRLIAESLFVAPTPMIAVVFVCVVLTGIPRTEERSRQDAAARSAEKP